MEYDKPRLTSRISLGCIITFTFAPLLQGYGPKAASPTPTATSAPATSSLPANNPASSPASAPRNVALLTGLGSYHYRVSGCSEEAQQYFDQGLRLYYGFYLPEALASFTEAASISPECAMAHWGAALACAPVPNSRYLGFPDDPKGRGAEEIGRAVSLMDNASAVEIGLIGALRPLLDVQTHPEPLQRSRAYHEAMRDLFAKYPDDPEVGTLFACAYMTHTGWVYWTPDGQPLPGTLDAVSALERVMQALPEHPGANHLYIHILESSQHPETALPQAERLARTMPIAGHIVHMPSHIYVRIGRYAAAIRSNQDSAEADKKFAAEWGSHPIPIGFTYPLSSTNHGHHAHEFLFMAALLRGNYAEALYVSSMTAASIPPQALHSEGTAQRRFVRPWLTQKTFGKWQEILNSTPPKEMPPFVEGVWCYVKGSALAKTGKLKEADRELATLRSIAARPGMDKVRVRVNSAELWLTVAGHVLEGEIAAKRGKLDQAIAHLDTAVRLEDGFAYMEPPDWGHPVRHVLGAILLEAKRPAEAESVYWEDLRRNPENGWSLFGLWQALQAQGKDAAATRVHERFKKAWEHADATLTSSCF